MKVILWACLWAFTVATSRACIWDADTLKHEQVRSKDLATAILGEAPTPDDPAPLRARIAELSAHPETTNADWYNNLAGAYLRLHQPAETVKLLEPVVAAFPGNYGIHANLGTAYHLLGRYADAEKEIARDLEINPDAHFGLEKYHLALLQYLTRDTHYQLRHVYVDELTVPFLAGRSSTFRFYNEEMLTNEVKEDFPNGLPQAENELAQLGEGAQDATNAYLLAEISTLDPKPAYRAKWNLATDTNLEAGVIYMAQMNPREPACFTMLGAAAWKKRDFNLAVKAFEKAVALNSPQTNILNAKIKELNHYIDGSLSQGRGVFYLSGVILVCLASILAILVAHGLRRIRGIAK